MRTTLDIPQDLLRKAKAEAALRGIPLKDYVAEAIRAALQRDPGSVAESGPDYGANRQVLADDCVFPLIRGEGGPALRDLTPERVHQILEEEEVERALDRTPSPR
ncbi:MAG: hypothetical protein ACE5HV_08670 [Acidobacteriota bacterium]